MTSKDNSWDTMPYLKFSSFSQDFVNEVYFRIHSAQRALDVFHIYKRKKPRDDDEKLIFETLKFIMPRFAVLETATLLDRMGKYSLQISRNTRTKKWSVAPRRLMKLMDGLSEAQLKVVHQALSTCLIKYSSLIDRIMATRNEKLAHAGSSRYKVKKVHLKSYRFPNAQMDKLLNELFKIIIHSSLAFARNPIEQIVWANRKITQRLMSR